jgi:hypothetical protein
LWRARLWNRALKADRLCAADAAALDGLVAEFLPNADADTTAAGTAQGNDGRFPVPSVM